MLEEGRATEGLITIATAIAGKSNTNVNYLLEEWLDGMKHFCRIIPLDVRCGTLPRFGMSINNDAVADGPVLLLLWPHPLEVYRMLSLVFLTAW